MTDSASFRYLRRVAVVLLMGGVLAVVAWFLLRQHVYLFPGWSGPEGSTVVAAARPAMADDFGEGATSRLAILVVDPESSWLGLARGLTTIGVPFRVTQDWRAAFQHRVVWVYPAISGKLLPAEALQSLVTHVSAGGTVIASEIVGGGVESVFGFSEITPSRVHRQFIFEDEAMKRFGLAGEEERALTVGDSGVPTGTHSYRATTAKVLARYEDGAAAMLERNIGAGRAIAIGIEAGAVIGRGYDHHQEFARHYINAYQPAVDVLLRAVRALYLGGEPDAVVLDTVPEGRAVSVMLTHDVDYSQSMVNAIPYAEIEKERRTPSTYFVQTKYVRDWNDEIFFDDHGVALARQLHGLGAELASHSVAHSKTFSRLELGDGQERYPDYVPFVRSRFDTQRATILGELRVSRFLLEKAVPESSVQGFRPGHLQYPTALPQALAASGYRYSSSMSSGSALTHLPFRLSYDRANTALVDVFEFPITIEDELDRPMTGRLDDAVEILKRLARYGGSCTVLIHPDVLDDKFEFEERFVEAAGKLNAWFGTLGEFGAWWAARDALRVDVRRVGPGRRIVALTAPRPIEGLRLTVPPGWTWRSSDPAGTVMKAEPGHVRVSLAAGRALLVFEDSERRP